MRITKTSKVTGLAAAALLGTTAATGMVTPAHADEPAPGPTMHDLQNAELPATCELPAGSRLTDGKYDGGAGKPHAALTGHLTFADIDHDGVQDGVAAIACDAGNVTWPDALVIVGQGGKLKGWLDLGKQFHTAKGHVTSISAEHTNVRLAFQSSDPTTPQQFSRGDVNWTDTGPVFAPEHDQFGDAPLDFDGIGPVQFATATWSQLQQLGLGKDYGHAKPGCMNYGPAGVADDLQLHYTFDADGKLTSVGTSAGFVHTPKGEVAQITTADQVRANWGEQNVIARDTVFADGLYTQPSLVVQHGDHELIFALDSDHNKVTRIVAHSSTDPKITDFHGAGCTAAK